jgi:hypothetical protein
MSRWRDLLLVVVLFAVLIGFTVYGANRSQRDDSAPPGSVHSASDLGAYGLRSWLQSLGYNARPFQNTTWRLSDDADALFMLAPDTEPVTAEEADETLRWVRNGGTLILIVPDPPAAGFENALIEQLGAEIVVPDPEARSSPMPVAVTQPVLVSPPVTQATVDSRATLTLERNDYVPLVTTEQGNVLVGFREERGYVYLGTSAAPFVNRSIRAPDNPALVLNLLRSVPQGGRILFDEIHHGLRARDAGGRSFLDYWWGWAVLYSMGITGLYLVLTGRRFGRAVPLPQDIARRSSAEYVESLATMFQRAGKRSYIAQQHHDRFKRRIARPYGFVPASDDEQFLRDLERYAAPSAEQRAAIQGALVQLRQANSDEQLAQTVRAADALLDARGRLR